MHKGFWNVGQVVVEYMGNIVHVDSPRGDIGCDQYADLLGFEIAKSFLPPVLAFVAVNGGASDSRFFQNANDFVGSVLCSGKDQNFFHLGMGEQQFFEKSAFAPFVDAVEFLLDALYRRALRSDFNSYGVLTQNGSGELCDFGRHRRAEKKILALRRKKPDDFANIVDESHVEHSVRFVQNKKFEFFQADDSLVD